MRLSKTTARYRLAVVLLSMASVLLVSGAPDDRRLSVYSNAANFSLTVQARNGVDYVGLLEVLEPLGTVTAKTSGHHWKLRFNEIEGEFTDGKLKAKLRGVNFDLPASFILENGRGLVPLSGLTVLLSRFLGGPVNFHEAARRLFIGDVAVHFTAQITSANPPTLVLNFTAPVNPAIATEPGRLAMNFSRDGVIAPGTQTLAFANKAISSATFQENNGAADLVITGGVPMMASFSNGNHTITIVPPQSAATPQPSTTPVVPTSTAAITAQPSANPSETRRYFAVIDAAHGGSENGATLAGQLLEKDITMAMARRLRDELGARHLNALLVRDGDVSMTADQRATVANTVHPAVYVCIHATSQATGVRVFTSLLSDASATQGPFVEWENAQSEYLAASESTAKRLATALQTLNIPVQSLPAALEPLNHLRTAAVAIEIAPPDANTGPDAPAYQESVARMIAVGLAAMHDELEMKR